MFLLFDECCPRSLVEVAEASGHTGQRTIDVAVLGRQAADADIFAFAQQTGAILVAVNSGDFIRLAGRGRQHSGVILIPSISGAQLRPLFVAVLAAAEQAINRRSNQFIEIDAKGKITSFEVR